MDITRHFAYARIISRTPDLYYRYSTPLFHALEAAAYDLALSDRFIFEWLLVYLNIMLIVSFFSMCNAYLSHLDRRIPLVATFLWTFFSGLGWLYFLELIFWGDVSDLTKLYYMCWSRTYFDVGYGMFLWLSLWFRDLSLGFVFLFTLLLLMNRIYSKKDVNWSSALFLLNTISLWLIHPPEAIILAVFFMVAYLMSYDILKPVGLAALGIAIALSFYGVFFLKFGSMCEQSVLIFACVLELLFSILLLLSHRRIRERFSRVIESSIRNVQIRIAMILVMTLLLLIMFIHGLFVWPSLREEFLPYFWGIGAIPWFIYPVRFGTVGFIAILTIPSALLTTNNDKSKGIAFFTLSFIFLLLFGKILSAYNSLFSPIYSERRILPIAFACASVIAAYGIVRFFDYALHLNLRSLKRRLLRHYMWRSALMGLLLGLLTFSGTFSSALTAERSMVLPRLYGLEPEVVDAIRLLSSYIEEHPRTMVITASLQSSHEVEASTAPWRVKDERYLQFFAWEFMQPEGALSLLYDYRYSQPFLLYLHKRDLYILDKPGYLPGHVLPYLSSKFYANTLVNILKLPQFVPPYIIAPTVLAIPPADELNENYLFLYDILSIGGYAYTTALYGDTNIKGKTLILCDDGMVFSNATQMFADTWARQYKTIIIFNSVGNGPLARYFFNMPLKADAWIVCEGAYIHMPIGYNRTYTNITLAPNDSYLEFILDNDLTWTPASCRLADDDQSVFWKPCHWGRGNISITHLYDDFSIKVSGNNSLRIEVGPGTYAQWGLVHYFTSPQNWTNYDFMAFYWYGHGDNNWYAVYIFSKNSHRCFEFRDTWRGWRRVILPLKAKEGKYIIDGIHINIYRVAGSEEELWKNVKSILIKATVSAANLRGTWFLDAIGLDVGRCVSMNLIIEGCVEGLFRIFTFDVRTSRFVSCCVLKQGSAPVKNFTLLAGIDARSIYPSSKEIGNISISRRGNRCNLTLTLRLPPDNGFDRVRSGLSQVLLRIEAPLNVINTCKIVGVHGSIYLPIDLNVTMKYPLRNVEVLSYYEDKNDERKSPLALRLKERGRELYYFDILPLISALKNSNSKMMRESLIDAFKNILTISGCNLSRFDRKFSLKNLLIAREISLSGNIQVTATSLSIKMRGYVHLRIDEREVSDVISMFIYNLTKFSLSLNHIKINNGIGFYVHIPGTQGIKLALYGVPVTLLVVDSSGQVIIKQASVIEVEFLSSNYDLFIRAPRVMASGKLLLRDVVTFGTMRRIPSGSGHRMVIEGRYYLSILISDVYTIINDIKWQGSVSTTRPMSIWDEIKTMIILLPDVFLVLVSVLISMWFLTLRNRSSKRV